MVARASENTIGKVRIACRRGQREIDRSIDGCSKVWIGITQEIFASSFVHDFLFHPKTSLAVPLPCCFLPRSRGDCSANQSSERVEGVVGCIEAGGTNSAIVVVKPRGRAQSHGGTS